MVQDNAIYGNNDYSRKDQLLFQVIEDKLRHVSNFDATQIEILVSHGIVTLNGEVEDLKHKEIIQQSLKSLAGIKEIINNLKI